MRGDGSAPHGNAGSTLGGNQHAGLLFVDKVGPGAFAGVTITANIQMSLIIDEYGWFGGEVHPLSTGRMAGAALMGGGIALISRF